MAPAVDLERLLEDAAAEARAAAGRPAAASAVDASDARTHSARAGGHEAAASAPRQAALPKSAPAHRPTQADVLRRLHVEGVMVGGSTKLAVINGTILEVGQQIEGVIISAITAQGIAVEIDGRIYRVPITGPQKSAP